MFICPPPALLPPVKDKTIISDIHTSKIEGGRAALDVTKIA